LIEISLQDFPIKCASILYILYWQDSSSSSTARMLLSLG